MTATLKKFYLAVLAELPRDTTITVWPRPAAHEECAACSDLVRGPTMYVRRYRIGGMRVTEIVCLECALNFLPRICADRVKIHRLLCRLNTPT